MKSNFIKFFRFKKLLLFFLFCIILVFSSIKIYSYNKSEELKRTMQHKILVELNGAQIQIEGILSANSRHLLKNLAQTYEQLGETFACTSTVLFEGSYLDSGEWGYVSDILLGQNSKGLFQTFDGTLTAEEIAVLQELYNYNDTLIVQIHDASNQNPNTLIDLSTEELENLLNKYHLFILKEFTNKYL